LLDPADKQNVPYAVTLFEELSKTVPLTNNISRDVYQEIECLNEFVRPLLNIFINPTINLFDQLIGLAYSSHLMLFIYRKWKKNFLTRDLYQDIQATIQDAFVCTFKLNNIDQDLQLFLYQLGTDQLENEFSDIRTISHSLLCDYYELIQRYKISLSIGNIYAKHPDWRKSSRLSTKTTDHSSLIITLTS